MSSMRHVVNVLSGRLEGIGLRRQGSVWIRTSDVVSYLVDFQRSSHLGDVAINVGVLDHDVYRRLWPGRRVVSVADCLIRERVNPRAEKRDPWWSVTELLSSQDLQEEILTFIRKFFSDHTSPQQIISWLERRGNFPAERIGLAILYDRVGKTNEACAVVDKIAMSRSSSWGQLAIQIKSELKCEC